MLGNECPTPKGVRLSKQAIFNMLTDQQFYEAGLVSDTLLDSRTHFPALARVGGRVEVDLSLALG